VTHQALLETLSQLGLESGDPLGVRVQQRVVLARDGSVRTALALPQLLTAWSRLFGVLRSALPDHEYHSGRELCALSQHAAGVTASFSDGSRHHADLLVAADGLRSTVRRQLLPDTIPLYAGYVAWRGTVDESRLSARVRQQVLPYFAFDLPPHEQLVAYPIAGVDDSAASGRRRLNFVWYRPAGEADTLRDMLTDNDGRHWPEGIPPPRVRAGIIEGVRRAAGEVLSPQFAEVVGACENLFFQPIFDLASPQIAFGRVVLLGDASFVARPHCGMGVTKAADDAMALTQALNRHDSVDVALRAYERGRLGEGQRIVAHARALGAYMQAQLRTPEERETAERHRSPEAVVRETAVPL